MRTKSFLALAVFLTAALTMLGLASGGSAKSLATCSPANGVALEAAVHNASCTVIKLKAATTTSAAVNKAYFTDDAGTPALGFEIDHTATIQGPLDSSGNCKAQTKSVVDGNPAPGGGTASNGPVFTVEANNVTFKCFTVRYGTDGIESDGFDGLNVQMMNFVGNGRDQAAGAGPLGDGIWVKDGDNVRINSSTFSGMGNDGVESDASVPGTDTNSGWSVKKNTLKNIHNSCLDLSNNTRLTLGELVSGKPANGNTCTVAGTASVDPAIRVDDQGFSGLSVDANKLYLNTVTNAFLNCFTVAGNFAQVLSNTCVTSHNGEGLNLAGDDIKADLFTTTISSGGTGGDCVDATGDRLKLTNTKCGSTRAFGIEVHGSPATVTTAQVRQTANTCFNSDGDAQTWSGLTCGQVTGNGGTDYGAYANGDGTKFTNVTLGDTNDAIFYSDGPNQVWTTVKGHGSSNGMGIAVNRSDTTFNGFDITSSYDACAADLANGEGGNTFKNGHCGRVLNDSAVWGVDDPFTIDTVNVDAALDDCFAYYDGGNAIDGTLKNSTALNCGTGVPTARGAEWEGTGTNSITGNDLGQSSGESLNVDTLSGDYTITNNKFHDAQTSSCVIVSEPDTLSLTGNKAQMCYDAAFNLVVQNNPVVNSNIGNDASSLFGTATMFVQCDTDCSTAHVNLNKLDGGGNEAQGLYFCDNVGTPGATVSSNTVTNMSGTGIEIACNGGVTANLNTVLNSSDVDDLYGIFLNSDGNTLTNSNVSGGVDNGIEVDGDANILDGNKSHDNGENGIYIRSSATNTVLGGTTGNTTNDNFGEGTEDDGASTIDRNSSTGNRQDCAGSGGGLYGATVANVCTDGSTFSDPGNIFAPVKKGFSSIF
jgi:Right handed beta helix region